MSSRYVFPELFSGSMQAVKIGEKSRIGLRWMINSSIGLPKDLFEIWRFKGRIDHKRTAPTTEQGESGLIVSWPEGPCAAIELVLDVPVGAVSIRSFSAAKGAGHLIETRLVNGPVDNLKVALFGSPIASLTISGTASIQSLAIIPIHAFVNHDGWQLIERVGLPVSKPTFNDTGYSMELQGPVGAETDPVKAAIIRVKNGTPDAGWNSSTDRGISTPPFVHPNPEVLVIKESTSLLESIAQLLIKQPDPAKHADQFIDIVTRAPKSLHGIDASTEWQFRAKPSRVRPLPSLLLNAGMDPYAALALGFGTTLDPPSQQVLAMAAAGSTGSIIMITVKQKVKIEIKVPLSPDPVSFILNGELATLCFPQKAILPDVPSGVQMSTATGSIKIDPPAHRDEPWLETNQLNWTRPANLHSMLNRAVGFSIASQLPGKPITIRTPQRLSGGWLSFIPATNGDSNQPAKVRFADHHVSEPFPGEQPGMVYSVAAHDIFGRWSGWTSVDHDRLRVNPQIPALHSTVLVIADTNDPIHPATASLEFTWDWSHRSPGKIQFRLLVHEEGTDPPPVSGSILAVGSSVIPDVKIDFGLLDKDHPPASVELIPDEGSENLKKYKLSISGLSLDFGQYTKIRVTCRARATERFDLTRLSKWSNDITTMAASPTPPPSPFVPAAMQWSSIPDPQGISIAALNWNPSAPRYAVYCADESAIAREFDLPSPDLEISPSDRLPHLRLLNMRNARRAFTRVATNISANTYNVVLPKNSKSIHFYGIVPISATGVEGKLSGQANDYFAVAAPVIKTPEIPLLIARFKNEAFQLTVKVDESKVPVSKIEIYRAPTSIRAVQLESMGPPVMTIHESDELRSGNVITWSIQDSFSGSPWQAVYYRAVAYGRTIPERGNYGGKSQPSPAAEVVRISTTPPSLIDLHVETDLDFPTFRLLSFLTNAPLHRTSNGVHQFNLKIYATDMSFTMRSAQANEVKLYSTTFPDPPDEPNTFFRHDPLNPQTGRTFAWIPADWKTVLVEIIDPSGKTTKSSLDL